MKLRGAHGRALRLEFRPVRLHAHGVVDGQRRHDSALVRQNERRGVPMLALCAAMAGGLLALLSSVIAASTVYLVLVALSGLSAVVVWIAIAYCQIVFRRRWLESGHSTSELKYRTPGYPYVSWAAFILCTASFVLVIFRRGATVRARGRARVHRGLLWGVFPATVGTQAQKGDRGRRPRYALGRARLNT